MECESGYEPNEKGECNEQSQISDDDDNDKGTVQKIGEISLVIVVMGIIACCVYKIFCCQNAVEKQQLLGKEIIVKGSIQNA